MLILEPDLEMVLIPEHQIGAAITVVVQLMDSAVGPRVESIPEDLAEMTKTAWWPEEDRIRKCAILHLDAEPHAIIIRHLASSRAAPSRDLAIDLYARHEAVPSSPV
jgi:hypothetical protein